MEEESCIGRSRKAAENEVCIAVEAADKKHVFAAEAGNRGRVVQSRETDKKRVFAAEAVYRRRVMQWKQGMLEEESVSGSSREAARS